MVSDICDKYPMGNHELQFSNSTNYLILILHKHKNRDKIDTSVNYNHDNKYKQSETKVGMNKITKYLNKHISGNVFDKDTVLEAYSYDRSPLKITPRFVAVPHTTEDVQFLVRFANDLSRKGYNLPITVRGSGLDKTGADLGDGLVISTEKMSNIEEIDDRGRLVRVQAGVTMEKLNAVLAYCAHPLIMS